METYGIGLLVNQFAGPLNKFINSLTGSHNVDTVSATKVVPIVSFGTGTHVGAAQITGPEDQVSEVKAVAQLESNFHGHHFRIKALIPINSINPFGAHRVQGVGVSAIIDVRL